MSQQHRNTSLKYLTPDNLYEQIKALSSGMAVTKGMFELVVPSCTLEDLEWNHMDQMHRFSIHNTYEKNVRIALDANFAISLTQWQNWPFLITVTDVYVAKGLFYQSLTLAGFLFLHSVISMEDVGNDSIKLKHEWYIASHRFLRFLHKTLDKKLYSLNERLQKEDEQLRQGRFQLRKEGFTFKTDNPNYYNSNVLGQHTIYPSLEGDKWLSLSDVTTAPQLKKVGNLQFIIKRDKDTYLIWPAACPHEGGPLMNGKLCEAKISCPWHGLQFSAAQLSPEQPLATRYGFEYQLLDNAIHVNQIATIDQNCGAIRQDNASVV